MSRQWHISSSPLLLRPSENQPIISFLFMLRLLYTEIIRVTSGSWNSATWRRKKNRNSASERRDDRLQLVHRECHRVSGVAFPLLLHADEHAAPWYTYCGPPSPCRWDIFRFLCTAYLFSHHLPAFIVPTPQGSRLSLGPNSQNPKHTLR